MSLNQTNSTGTKTHITKRGFKTQREARKWETNYKAGPQNEPVKYPTFLQAVKTWEAYCQASEGTIRQHSEHFRIRFAKYLDKPINEFDKPTLINWRIELSGGPWATKTKNTTIDRKFLEAKKLSGVKNIRLHDLRHSHATVLINAGVNIVAVSKRLGHSTIDQTLKTYTHLLESSDQNMMRKINELAAESHAK